MTRGKTDRTSFFSAIIHLSIGRKQCLQKASLNRFTASKYSRRYKMLLLFRNPILRCPNTQAIRSNPCFVTIFYLCNSNRISTALGGLFYKIGYHLSKCRGKFLFFLAKEG